LIITSCPSIFIQSKPFIESTCIHPMYGFGVL
jgi:hypothetical protein